MWCDFNTQLFLLVNASDKASKLLIYFAIFCAKYLVYIPIIIMGIGWFIRPFYRQLILKMVISLGVALFVAFIIRHCFYSPRPFAVDVGTHNLFHDNTSSLPSQHAVFVWTIFFTVLFNYTCRFRIVLYLFALIAVLVSWSRVYLGIHWPLDIAVGFLVSIISVYLIKKFWISINKLLNRWSCR
ncbi:phosphatase PAP2 family protein [Gilliamella sp. ESL0254]|uniref:phosphatase PAP2 family protein n=1 Tax=Gilliamella sp. ESL0254 TaxID=2705035 RepID=UPI001580F6FF|nr:phosphatase PAP2 family protein [Gilliamella sp. ESL0254]NUF27362.1 phosphatase PAP2 family protein [Gilliamella sp. ESL0254]